MATSQRHRGWKWDAANSRLSVYVDGTEVARFDDATNDLALLTNGLAITAGGLTVTAGGATITAGGLTVTAGGATVTAGGLTVTAGGLLVTSGRIREVMTPTEVNAQNYSFVVAAIAGGIVVHTSATGAGTVTLDTAAHIIAGSNGVGALTANGQTIACWYINDGDQTLTFANNGDGKATVADTGQTLAANESALLLFRRTAADAVLMYMVGG